MEKISTTLFALILSAALCLSAVAQTQPDPNLQVRQKTFEKIWEIVNEKYFDATFGGVDWKAIHSEYAPKIEKVRSDAEFYVLMARMLGVLKTSHLEILTPDILERIKQPPAIIGLGFRELENRVVITKIMDNTSAAQANLKIGFVIAKIDGTPVTTFTDVNEKLRGAANTTLKLAYLDEKDEIHEVTLERRPLGQDNKSSIAGVNFYAIFDSKRLEDKIGYIRFTNFLEFLNPQIRSAIESMHDSPGMIIDMRGNSGGDDSVGLKMASLFFEKETLLMITKMRKGDNFEYKTKPPKDPFRGKVVILVDEFSRSAAEQFSAGMQESGRAVVIGKTTAGGDMDGELVKLPDGSMFLYSVGQPRTPKGYIVEGHGVKPDIEVSLTRKDLLDGKDSQLRSAIDYIKSGKR